MKRRFSRSEREQLLLAAGGRCQECGCELEDFHADHVIPHSKDGITDVINGQALCPACNLRKGARLGYREPPLFGWQDRALRAYFSEEGGLRSRFLCEATPGAGKTIFALAAASRLLKAGEIDRVFVVVPRTSLETQWKEVASKLFGIQLKARWKGGFAPDIDGIVLTYQQLRHSAGALRTLSYRRGMAIMDEIHHCNEDASWGQALQVAFEEAGAKLALSGTPFRSDNGRIPFINYTDDEGHPDFRYGYNEALDDHVVRSVFFPQMGGTVRWLPPDEKKEREHSFEDVLSEKDRATRLRMAVRPEGEWFATTIRLAHERLLEYRQKDSAPAGIVFTYGTREARDVARVIKRLTGANAVVVTSDEEDAPQKLQAFAKSNDPWIVAVQMVSEGVDIPRLRVAVYATNVTEKLFFRQAIGRVVRRVKGETDATAAVFIPDDPDLRSLADSIRVAVAAHLESESGSKSKLDSEDRDKPQGPTFLSSKGEHVGTLSPGNEPFSVSELEVARQRKLTNPIYSTVSDELVAAIIRDERRTAPVPPSPPVIQEHDLPLDDRKQAVRSQAVTVYRSLGYQLDIPHREVMWRSKETAGIKGSLEDATLDQLEAWRDLAHKWRAQGSIDT